MENFTNDDLLTAIRQGKKIIPFMTIKAMGERWGMDRHKTYNLSRRDEDFPKPIQGVLKGLSHSEKVYPFYEVERYEKEKGLIKNKRKEVTT